MDERLSRIRERFLAASLAASFLAKCESSDTTHAKSLARWSGIIAGKLIYGVALVLGLLMGQTISILVGACVLKIFLHAPLSHFGTWMAAILTTVPMHVRQKRWQRGIEQRRLQAKQQVIEDLGRRVARAFETAKQEAANMAARIVPSRTGTIQ